MFINECLLTDLPPKAGRVASSSQELYAMGRTWFLANGHQVMSQKNFIKRLKDRGHHYVNKEGWRGFPTVQMILGGEDK